MLEDEHGRDFVEAAVTTWGAYVVAGAAKYPPVSDAEKERLGFAHLILDDEGGT